jgi:hypothetical protein
MLMPKIAFRAWKSSRSLGGMKNGPRSLEGTGPVLQWRGLPAGLDQ